MILDTIIILELAVIIYLLWQFIPVERQKEEIRKVMLKNGVKSTLNPFMTPFRLTFQP